MQTNEGKERMKLFDIGTKWIVLNLHWGCKLWGWRGLKTCKQHGFHAQSWITGRCWKCNPKYLIIKDTLKGYKGVVHIHKVKLK